MFSIYSLLFESFDYYYPKFGISGKLNQKEARKHFYEVLKFTMDRVNNKFVYEPHWLSNQSEHAGMLIPTQTRTVHGQIVIDYNKKQINVPYGFEYSPVLFWQLKSVQQTFPEFGSFPLVINGYKEKYDKNLEQFVSSGQQVSDSFKDYDKSTTKHRDINYEVEKTVQEVDWYHVTRKTNLGSIKRIGLVPSKEFINPQQRGWTQRNPNLQNVVYLTKNYNRAKNIAEVLIQKYNEPAVILKVFGEALSDYSKLVVDEDEIYQHEEKPSKPGVPDYLLSVIGETESIGYEGTISWKYIEVVEVIRENLKEAD